MGFKSGLFQLNLVSVGLVLLLGVIGYSGWKFAPVFWQAQKVDQSLHAVKFEASKIQANRDDPRLVKLTDKVFDACVHLGIDEDFLEVYFSDDLKSIHADYRAVVQHPFGKTTTIEFERSLDVPQPDLGD